MFDAAAPDGSLSPAESARLDGWFSSLGLGYGDSIYVDGAYAGAARDDVARIAGRYGLLLSDGAPVTAGAVPSGHGSGGRQPRPRRGAELPELERASRTPISPTASMSNYGCAVNSNLAAMVANPEDLIHGREGSGVGDAMTSSKAVRSYRSAAPTGTGGLQDISTKKKDQ